MTALAHHVVTAIVQDAAGTITFGAGTTWQQYCSLDKRGEAVVRKAAQGRFPRALVRVEISGGCFYATVTQS